MARDIQEQLVSLIKDKHNILIAVGQSPSLDAIASSLALKAAITKQGKKCRITAHDFHMPTRLNFLPHSQTITQISQLTRKFIINLDVSKYAVEEVSYETVDNQLQIFITPKDGNFTEEDVTTTGGNFYFDLIITLDIPELAQIGPFYEDNSEFFYKNPILNIDHSPANDHFGHVNIVDIKATSVAEILYDVIAQSFKAVLSEDMATQLLTGIVSKTRCFQAGTSTPQALLTASKLMSAGGRREDIVKNLYQSKSLPVLKLWGRALARLKLDKQFKIVSSLLNSDDFAKSGATLTELTDVIEELIVNTPDAESIIIVHEQGGTLSATLYTPRYVNTLKVFAQWSPRASGNIT